MSTNTGGGGSGASITAGDTTVEITDSGTGYVAVTVDGTEIARFTDDGLLLTDADNGDPVLTIRNTGTGSSEPEIRFERTGAGAASQDIGHIKFFAKDDAGNNTLFANIFADALDETDGTEDGRIIFEVAKAGTTDVEILRLQSNEIVFNDASKDIDFRVESDNDAHMLFVDAGNDRVGIGTSSPDAPLHVETSGAGDAVIIESTDDGATDAPDVIFYRNSASPAVNDEIGSIRFRGKDSAAGDKDYNRITSVIRDTTDASADADLIFKSLSNSVEIEMMKISRIDGIVINEIGANYIDTRIESDNESHMFFVDASADKIGIGNSSPDATLDVEDGGTFRSTHLLTVSDSTASLNLSEALHAGRYVIYGGSGGTLNLPTTSTAGEHYAILNVTGGDVTISRNTNDINGAASNFTLGTYKAATCIAIGSNNWMVVG